MLKIFLLFILIGFSFSDQQLQINAQTIADYYPKIGLALGGGSAKGFYHLGIIEVLEENNIKLAAISGSSMGAVVGGIYALGYSSKDILDIISQIDLYNTFSHCLKKNSSFVYKKGWVRLPQKETIGFSDGKNVEDILQEYTLAYDMFRNFDFDNYPIKLRIVATEFPSGKKTIHQTGPLSKAIMSSISVPFVFRPFHWQDKYYLDGVLSEIVPLSVLSQMDILIGVNVVQLDLSEKSLSSPSSFALQYFDINVKNIGIKTFDLADVMITVPNDQNLTRVDFVKYQHFVNDGKKIAYKYLPQIEQLIANYDQKQEITVANIQADRLVIPKHTKKTSLSKLIRDIYYLNSQRSFTMEISDNEEGKAIKIFASEQVIEKIIIKPLKAENKYQSLLKKFIGKDFILYRGEIIKLLLNPKISKEIMKPIFDFQNGTLRIDLVPVKIQKIEVSGNQIISDQFIKKLLKIKNGQEFSQYLIDQSVEDLYKTGFFSEVEVSYKTDKDDQIILQFNLKEKQAISGWLGAEYFSLQKYASLTGGVDFFYNFFDKQFRTEAQVVYAQDYQSGLNVDFLLYDELINWRFNFREIFKKITVYPEEFKRSQKAIALNFQLFADFEFDFGVQNNLIMLPKNNNYKNLYLQFSFDNQDQKWLPEKGLKTKFSKFFGDENYLQVSFWYAKNLSRLGTIWFQTQYWDYQNSWIPEDFLLPNGMSCNQDFSSQHHYFRISYLRKIFLGINTEINFDYLKYAVDQESVGSALAFHYPNNLGLLTIIYSNNRSQRNWQLNLSKNF